MKTLLVLLMLALPAAAHDPEEGVVTCRNAETGEVEEFMWVCPVGWIQL